MLFPGLARAGRLSLALALAAGLVGRLHAEPAVDFDRQVHPILTENCFQCHGPDDHQRKAKLRLDVKDAALGHGSVIVPGHADRSELIERLTTDDPARRMPPAKTGKHLTPGQVELLRRWIDEGAKWTRHWAWVKPARPPLPPVADASWPRNPIDDFILARLEKEGLRPSPEADRVTLIRRVTLDLTGLPPMPA